MTDISSALHEAIEAISGDRTHGAARLAREAASVMARAARETAAETPEQMVLSLREVARSLAAGQPDMAAVANAVGAVVLAARTAAAGDVPAVRRTAIAEARRIVAGWKANVRLIVRHAETVVPRGAVLTHSHSATVLAVLERLAERGAPVIVTESRPLGEGRTATRLLADKGFSVSLIADAQAGVYVGHTAAVVVGADTVFADGTVVNKAGTLALALLARQHRVPFFVISESLKVSASRWKEGGETSPPTGSPDEPPAVYFDVTPPRLITALITEEGVFGTRELGPLARRARRWQRALGLAPASSA
jgi:translation initiation factor 2B subunit (eIF-2B alpha/beta/delta family)